MDDSDDLKTKVPSDLGLLIQEFKKNALKIQIEKIQNAFALHREHQRRRPTFESIPLVIWVIQPDGYKKVIDNPRLEAQQRRNDLVLQPWWEKNKNFESDLRGALSETLDLISKLFYLQNGAIPQFICDKQFFYFLHTEALHPFVSANYHEEDDGEWCEENISAWIEDLFAGVDCSAFIYQPEPATIDDLDDQELGQKFLAEDQDEYPDDSVVDVADTDEYASDEDDYVYDDPDWEEARREHTEEMYGYMDDQFRSDDDGWYYSDDDGYADEDY